MCTICGDPGQLQQEARIAITITQALISLPFIAIITWHAKKILQRMQQFKQRIINKLCRKKK